MEVLRITEVTDEIARDINGLAQQLRPDQPFTPATTTALNIILESDNVVFIIAKDGDRVVGLATLYVMPKVHKTVGSVEDVVVDETHRGHGLGEKLMTELIAIARSKGLQTLTLTSRPDRVAANKLYQKLNFIKKETNAYRLKL